MKKTKPKSAPISLAAVPEVQGVKLSMLSEFLCAFHLSRNVASNVFDSRGGISLVGSSGSLKTSVLKVLERYSDFCGISDLTVRGLHDMKEAMVDGKIGTLGFYEMQKLYARRDDISKSMEMSLMALMDEGLGQPNWKDQTIAITRAKCTVMGAMTRAFYNEMVTNWKGGMNRRMIFLHYSLADPYMTANAVVRWEKIPLASLGLPEYPTVPIRFDVSEKERSMIFSRLERFSKEDHAIHLQTLCRTLAVMRWNNLQHGWPDDSMDKIFAIMGMISPEPITIVSA